MKRREKQFLLSFFNISDFPSILKRARGNFDIHFRRFSKKKVCFFLKKRENEKSKTIWQ